MDAAAKSSLPWNLARLHGGASMLARPGSHGGSVGGPGDGTGSRRCVGCGDLDVEDDGVRPTLSDVGGGVVAAAAAALTLGGGTYTCPNSPSSNWTMLTYPSVLHTNNVRPSWDHAASTKLQ